MDKPQQTTLEELIEARTSRRNAIKGILAAGGAMTAVWCLPNTAAGSIKPTESSSSNTSQSGSAAEDRPLPELPHVYLSDEPSKTKGIGVVDGYRTQVLVRWGDPIFEGAEPLDLKNPTASAQRNSFGYNNDFIAFMPLEKGSSNSRHGLLCVNNEFTNPELMFTGVKYLNKLTTRTDEHIRIEIAAHGHSVVEIKQDDDAN